jgi:hypothetical protein
MSSLVSSRSRSWCLHARGISAAFMTATDEEHGFSLRHSAGHAMEILRAFIGKGLDAAGSRARFVCSFSPSPSTPLVPFSHASHSHLLHSVFSTLVGLNITSSYVQGSIRKHAARLSGIFSSLPKADKAYLAFLRKVQESYSRSSEDMKNAVLAWMVRSCVEAAQGMECSFTCSLCFTLMD